MNSLEALEELCSRCYVESEKCSCHARYKGGECSTSCEYKELLEKDLERLEKLEKENKELRDKLKEPKYKVLMGCRGGGKQFAQHVEIIKKEKQKLKKALDNACERLDWDCPVSQGLIDDLDCEYCKDTYKECWKKYFLRGV